MKQYKQSNDYELGLLNGMLIPYIAFNIITGVFFLNEPIDALQENTTYYYIHDIFGLKVMGALFLLGALLYISLWFTNRKYFVFMVIAGGILNVFLQFSYAYILMEFNQETSATGWRYIINGIINLSIIVGGVVTWRKIQKEIHPKKVKKIM